MRSNRNRVSVKSETQVQNINLFYYTDFLPKGGTETETDTYTQFFAVSLFVFLNLFLFFQIYEKLT